MRKSLPKKLLISLGIPTIFFPGLILASILGWNWQKNLSELASLGDYRQSEKIFPQQAKVTAVLDGDTFEIDNGQAVRLIGIDAPNRGELGFEEAKNFLTTMIDGETIKLEYDYYQDDKFGRILAYAWENCAQSLGCQDGQRLVNWVLVKEKQAKVVTYEDRRKLKYEEILKEAEK